MKMESPSSSSVEFRSTSDKVETVLEEKKDDEPNNNNNQRPVPTEAKELQKGNEEQPSEEQQQQQRQEEEVDTRTTQRTESSDTRGGETKADDVSVSFGSVIVREYERVIDSTSIYMGLALGWDFNESSPIPVDDDTSPSPKGGGGKAPHGGDESRMKRTNGSERYGMLLRYGYAQKELKQATNEAAKFFKQRQREAARSLVVADERKKQDDKKKRKPLFGSMFRR